MDIDKPQPDQENELSALERRLTGWRPATGGLNRDRMLYEAGRAAARAEGRSRLWQLATAALTLMIAGLAGLLSRERSQRLALETALAFRGGAARPMPPVSLLAQTPTTESLPPNSYFVLTAHLTASDQEAPALAVGNDVKPTKSDPAPLHALPLPLPLRSRDLNRVLDL
jgi:hypothetical protein